MKPLFSVARSAALAIAVSSMLSGCDLFGDPPTQLEAKLSTSESSIEDREALARRLVERLNIKELKLDNVRVAFDEEKNTHFFRLVGEEALPPALLKQVAAGLAKMQQDSTWQGKLIVEADATVDAFLKTDKREFAVVAPWQSAEVEAYLMRSAAQAMFAGRSLALGQPDLPKQVACMLSFTPKESLPELKGALKDVMPEQANSMAAIRLAAMMPQEITVPHRIAFAQPELAKLDAPVVQDGKVLFQFALIEDANVSVIGGGIGGGAPLTIDHGTIDRCRSRLGEVAPRVQDMMDRTALLAEVSAIGPAQLVALPKAQ